MGVLKVLTGAVLALAMIAVGIFVDIKIFFIGGIQDLLDGWEQSPKNAKTIAWGLVEIFGLTGVGLAVTIWLLVIGLALVGLRKR